MASEMVCSFCGASQAAGRRLVGGPNGVAICAGCVALCAQVLEVETEPSSDPGGWRRTITGTGSTDQPTG